MPKRKEQSTSHWKLSEIYQSSCGVVNCTVNQNLTQFQRVVLYALKNHLIWSASNAIIVMCKGTIQMIVDKKLVSAPCRNPNVWQVVNENHNWYMTLSAHPSKQSETQYWTCVLIATKKNSGCNPAYCIGSESANKLVLLVFRKILKKAHSEIRSRRERPNRVSFNMLNQIFRYRDSTTVIRPIA